MVPLLFLVLAWLAMGEKRNLRYIRYASRVPNLCLDFGANWGLTMNEEHHYRGIQRSVLQGVLVGVSDVQALVGNFSGVLLPSFLRS
jgi:hypothetical protein